MDDVDDVDDDGDDDMVVLVVVVDTMDCEPSSTLVCGGVCNSSIAA